MVQVTEPGKFVAHTTKLKEGQDAPYFEGKNEKGELIKLTDFKQQKLLLYFYPKDSTPTCTDEACSLRDDFSELSKAGISVLGVSADTEKSHLKFSKKYGLPFSLIADTELQMIQAYDVWGQKMLFGRIYDGLVRTSFLIDENGLIRNIIRAVDSKAHAQQILSLI